MRSQRRPPPSRPLRSPKSSARSPRNRFAVRRQSANRKSIWRRPCAGLYRRRCRAGNAPSDAAWMPSSRAPSTGVRKAVKWHSRFYGVKDSGESQTWFLSFHRFTKYVKVTFCRGTSLDPVPPGASKVKGVRYLEHPRRRCARRSSARPLGEASEPNARRTNVSASVIPADPVYRVA